MIVIFGSDWIYDVVAVNEKSNCIMSTSNISF